MREIPGDVRLTVKSAAPEWFFRSEAGRDLEIVAERFDSGPVQASNFAIAWPRSVREALAVERAVRKRLDAEAAWLEREGVRLVVCDVAPAPLAAAAIAGIPSFAVVNFTWVEIFRAQAARDPRVASAVRQWRRDYASAGLALRTPLHLPMPYLRRVRDIPLIARPGRSCRRRLEAHLGVPRGTRIVLVYLGIWGHDAMPFARLAELPGVAFVTFWPTPAPVVHLDTRAWSFPDVVASVDAVVAKPGYGTAGECMANGTPTVYYPRPEFAEYPALREGLDAWGGAVRISRRDLLACRWRGALDEAFALDPPRADASGARVAAREILRGMAR